MADPLLSQFREMHDIPEPELDDEAFQSELDKIIGADETVEETVDDGDQGRLEGLSETAAPLSDTFDDLQTRQFAQTRRDEDDSYFTSALKKVRTTLGLPEDGAPDSAVKDFIVPWAEPIGETIVNRLTGGEADKAALRGALGIGAMFGKGIEQFGETAGLEFLKDYGTETAERFHGAAHNKIMAPRIQDWSKIKSETWFQDSADYLTSKFFEGIGNYGAIGAAYVGGGAVGGAGFLATISIGEVRDDLQSEGITDEATLGKYSYAAGLAVAALERVFPEYVAKQLSKEARKAMSKRVARAVAKGVYAGAWREGITEGLQEAIQISAAAHAKDARSAFDLKPVIEALESDESFVRVTDAMISGAIPGGAITGVTSAGNALNAQDTVKQTEGTDQARKRLDDQDETTDQRAMPGMVSPKPPDERDQSLPDNTTDISDEDAFDGLPDDVKQRISAAEQGSKEPSPKRESDVVDEDGTLAEADDVADEIGVAFDVISAALPKDKNGDPDFERLTSEVEKLGKSAWKDLTPEEQNAVQDALTSTETESDVSGRDAFETNLLGITRKQKLATIAEQEGIELGDDVFAKSVEDIRSLILEAKFNTSSIDQAASEVSEVVTPDGAMRVVVRPQIVELDDLTFASGDLQPRDRSRAESAAGVRQRAAGLDPARLQSSRTSDAGAPIILSDGTILSGNGRTMSIAEVYDQPALKAQADAYRASLGDGAKGFKKPVLVRTIEGPLSQDDLIRFADLSNRSQTAAMSATERAERDARAAGPEVMGLYNGGSFTSPINSEFFRAFQSQVVSESERGQMSRDGQVTKEGQDRMTAAVLAAAYGDSDLLARMLESTDDNIRSITGALRDAAGSFIRQKEAIRAGNASSAFDITPQIVDTAKKIADLRDRNIKPQTFLDQQDAFTDLDPVVESLLRAFYNDDLSRALSKEKLTEVLILYAEEGQKHQDNGLIPDETRPEDIITYAKDKATSEARLQKSQGNLFGSRAGTVGGDTRRSRRDDAGSTVESSEPSADQVRASLEEKFRDILAGTAPQKQWADLLGITDQELRGEGGLIEWGLKEKLLRKRKNGVARAPRKTIKPSKTSDRIDDIGEKIGGARKDLSVKTGKKPKSKSKNDDRPVWARQFAVVENKISETVNQQPMAAQGGNWLLVDRKSGRILPMSFETEAAAEAAIPLAAVAIKHRVRFVREADVEKYAIFRDVSKTKTKRVVAESFDSRESAQTYMAQNAVDILETKTSFGEEILKLPDKVVRTGKERRQGDVTPDQFQNVFGFRGVEFGNWNNQAERQDVMNHAFDGLLDLADVLGVPPQALSLNGNLALAFGARGQGLSGARAHYEPSYGVINLTKMSGAGTLAHEWFHGFDHYLRLKDAGKDGERITDRSGDKVLVGSGARGRDFATHGFLLRNSQLRDELKTAMRSLVETMYRKAEKYVQDTEKAEKWLSSARNSLRQNLERMRSDLASERDRTYYKRNNKPATPEQLAEFDALAEGLLNGSDLRSTWVDDPKSKRQYAKGRHSNDTLERLSAILKKVRGRNGFTSNNKGTLDRLRQTMRVYAERIDTMNEAKAKSTKTRKVPTSYATDAKSIDQGRATDYWTTYHEMAARAFSAYVEDKIDAQGYRSDFLSFGSDNKYYIFDGIRPFPEGKEREAINAKFDDLFDVLETQSTDAGIAMYALQAFHGSIHDFDQFAMEKVNTGEGVQAFGYGLYFTQDKSVANFYKNKLRVGPATAVKSYIIGSSIWGRPQEAKTTEDFLKYKSMPVDPDLVSLVDSGIEEYKKSPESTATVNILREIDSRLEQPGLVYEVEISAKDEDLLLFDKSFQEQSAKVRSYIREALKGSSVFNAWQSNGALEHVSGKTLYETLGGDLVAGNTEGQKRVSRALSEAGIKGIKFLDGNSRGIGEGYYNYVVFDDSIVTITKKNDVPLNVDYPTAEQVAQDDMPMYALMTMPGNYNAPLSLKGMSDAVAMAATDEGFQKIEPNVGAHILNLANDNKDVPLATPIGEQYAKAFFNQAIEPQDGGSVTATNLYEAYAEWAEMVGLDVMALPAFGRAFAGANGIQKAKISGRVRYIGIGIKDDPLKGASKPQIVESQTPETTVFTGQYVNDNVRDLDKSREQGNSIWQSIKDLVKTLSGDTKRSRHAQRMDEIVESIATDSPLYAIQSMLPEDVVAQDTDDLGFFSEALRAARNLKQERGTPEQMLSQLKKAGVKDAEIEVTNLRKLFGEKESVTKQDIIKHLEDNRVEVREAVKGDYVGEFERLLARDPNNPRIEEMRSQGLMNESHGTKYQDWSLSKNKNDPTYKETVVHLPDNTKTQDQIAREIGFGGYSTQHLTDAQKGAIEAKQKRIGSPVDVFRTGHWSEPNIIAHYRSQHLKTDKGETSLNIDELQSDWGQKLREGGARDEAKIAELKERVKGVDREIEAIGKEWDARHKADPNIKHIRDTPDLKKRQDEAFLLQAELRTAEAATHGNPLVNTTDQWVNVGLKKIITDAVNQGVDGITITPGKVQAERYNVSKVVPRIRVQDEGDVRFVFPEDRQGNPIGRLDVTQDGEISFAEGASVLTEAKGKQLTDVFGADIAKEILGARHRTILDVGEIELGGEGMKYAYDTMYPKKLTKLLQKIDKSIKPETRSVEDVGTVFYIPLSNQVREQVRQNGLPLFGQPKPAPQGAFSLAATKTSEVQLTPEFEELKPDFADLVRQQVEAMLPPDVAVNVLPKLTDPSGSGAAIFGLFLQKTVSLSLAGGPKKALEVGRHEVVHALRSAGLFTDQEWALLLERARKVKIDNKITAFDTVAGKQKPAMPVYKAIYKSEGKKRGLYGPRLETFVEEHLNQERVAKMVELWASKDVRYGKTIDGLFQRIVDFLEAIGNAFRGLGFQTPDSIFDTMVEGGIASRAEVEPALTPVLPLLAIGALHGSNNKFDNFDPDQLRDGLLQWGVNASTNANVVKRFARAQGRGNTPNQTVSDAGYVYKLEYPYSTEDLLIWDAPGPQQSAKVKSGLKGVIRDLDGQGDKSNAATLARYLRGQETAYEKAFGWAHTQMLGIKHSGLPNVLARLANQYGGQRQTAEMFARHGVKGIKYPFEKNTNHFVFFEPNRVAISEVKPADQEITFDLGGGLASIAAFHGSPHSFDKFSLDGIGTGGTTKAWHASASEFEKFDPALAGKNPNGGGPAFPGSIHVALRKEISGPDGAWTAAVKSAEGRVHVYEVDLRTDLTPMLDMRKRFDQQTPEVQRLIVAGLKEKPNAWPRSVSQSTFNGESFDRHNPSHFAAELINNRTREEAIQLAENMLPDATSLRLKRKIKKSIAVLKKHDEAAPDQFSKSSTLAEEFYNTWSFPADPLGFKLISTGDEVAILDPSFADIVKRDGKNVKIKTRNGSAVMPRPEFDTATSEDSPMYAFASFPSKFTRSKNELDVNQGNKNDQVEALSEIIAEIKSGLGMTVTQGRYGLTVSNPETGQSRRFSPQSNLRGQYDGRTGAARVRRSTDIEAIAHEGGHHLEAKFGQSLREIKRDGAAELEGFALRAINPDRDTVRPRALPPQGFSGYELSKTQQTLLIEAVNARDALDAVMTEIGTEKSKPRLSGKAKVDTAREKEAQALAARTRNALNLSLGRSVADVFTEDVRGGLDRVALGVEDYVRMRFSETGTPQKDAPKIYDQVLISEGFAEFFRTYILHNREARDRAPDFYEAFEDMLDGADPALLDSIDRMQLLTASQSFKSYSEATSLDRARADLVSYADQRLTTRVKDFLSQVGQDGTVSGWASVIYDAALDKIHPFYLMTRSLLLTADANKITDSEGRAVSLAVHENPYKLMRSVSDAFKTGLRWIQDGMPNYRHGDAGWRVESQDGRILGTYPTELEAKQAAEQNQSDKPVIKPNAGYRSASLHSALNEAMKGDWNHDTYNDFGVYLESRRAIEEWNSYNKKLAKIDRLGQALKAIQRETSALRVQISSLKGKQNRRSDGLTALDALIIDRDRQGGRLEAKERKDLLILTDASATPQRRENARQRLVNLRQEMAKVDGERDDLQAKRQTLEAETSDIDQQVADLEATISQNESAADVLKTERRRAAETGVQRAPHRLPLETHQRHVKQLDALHPQFKSASEKVYDFLWQSAVHDFQVGRLTQAELDYRATRKHFYVPFWRDLSDIVSEQRGLGGNIKRFSKDKAFKGSDRAIVNPIESIIDQSFHRAAATHFNEVMTTLGQLADRAGVGGAQIAEKVNREELIEANQDGFDKLEQDLVALGYDAEDARDMVKRVEGDFGDAQLLLQWSPENFGAKRPLLVPLWENGQRNYLRINDPDFAQMVNQTVNGIGKEMASLFIDALAKPATLLRIGVTTNPAFIGPNMIRDSAIAWGLTGSLMNPKTWPGITQVRGLYHEVMQTEYARMYQEVGGIMGGQNVAALSKVRDKADVMALEERGMQIKPLKAIASAAAGAAAGVAIVGTASAAAPALATFGAVAGLGAHKGLREFVPTFAHFADMSETATRLGVFATSYQAALKFNPSLTPYQAAQEAAYVSRDLIDFGRHGSRMLGAARLIPFLNANLQGMDKQVRQFLARSDRGYQMSLTKTAGIATIAGYSASLIGGPLVAGAAAVAAPAIQADLMARSEAVRGLLKPWLKKEYGLPLSKDDERVLGDSAKAWGHLVAYSMVLLAIAALYVDDDEYEMIDARFKWRAQPIKLGGDWYAIPKAFEWGIPSNLIEAAVDEKYKNDPRFWERVRGSLSEALTPPGIPQVARLWSDIRGNHNSLSGRPIVPEYMKKLEPQSQFSAYTSEFAIEASKRINESGWAKPMAQGIGRTIFANDKFEITPAIIDYALTSSLAYWGKDIQKGSNTFRDDGRRSDKIKDFPIVGTTIQRLQVDPFRAADATRAFWDQMSTSGGRYPRAAAEYSDRLKDNGIEEANIYLATLPEDEQAYALVQEQKSASVKKFHPLNRLDTLMRTVGKVQREIMFGEVNNTELRSERNPMSVSPGKAHEVRAILQQIVAMESSNTMRFLEHEQFKSRNEFEVRAVYDILQQSHPKIYDELELRFRRKKMKTFSDVKKEWPRIKADLLGEWERSSKRGERVPGGKRFRY